MPLNFVYITVQKSQKWPKTQMKRGPALKRPLKFKPELQIRF